jgi:hypothetical protein
MIVDFCYSFILWFQRLSLIIYFLKHVKKMQVLELHFVSRMPPEQARKGGRPETCQHHPTPELKILLETPK